VIIEGCVIRNVPVDGGSGVNLLLESTAFDLGYTSFEPTNQVLRMADQSRVNPVGKLSGIPTQIYKTTYELNYVVIRVGMGRPFPLLLGRPWLYSAGVKVNWMRKVFTLGDPSINIPWSTENHQGETSDSDGYTTDPSGPEYINDISSYQVGPFLATTEKDFGFSWQRIGLWGNRAHDFLAIGCGSS